MHKHNARLQSGINKRDDFELEQQGCIWIREYIHSLVKLMLIHTSLQTLLNLGVVGPSIQTYGNNIALKKEGTVFSAL